MSGVLSAPDLLKRSMSRVMIVGWPKTGKTTLAAKMGGGKSTDDLIHLGWSEARVSTKCGVRLNRG